MRRAGLLLSMCLLSCHCDRGRTEAPVLPPPQPLHAPLAHTPTVPKEETMSCPPVLVEARRGGTSPGAYVAPVEAELEAIEGAALAVLAGDEGSARTHATRAGFELVDVPEWDGTVVLRETKRRGGGAYVFRRGSTSSLVVQAPHTFFDEGTLPLACALFEQSKARALFINTAHRYRAAPEGQSADVAHLERSFFQSATLAVVRETRTPAVVQLHGFGRERAMKAVVSSGDARPGVPHVDRVVRALGAVLGEGVLRFPEDTRELGATTNVQGKAVRASGGMFLHVEMSEETRALLAADASKRTAVFAALARSMEER